MAMGERSGGAASGARRAGPRGFLWRRCEPRRFVEPGERAASWLVFDPGGGLAGALDLAASTDVLEADADEVLLLRRDELDVETVVRRTVERGGNGR